MTEIIVKKHNNPGKVVRFQEINNSGKSNFKTYLLITSLLAILASTIVIKALLKWTAIPEMPDLDLDFNWGPNVEPDTSIRPYRVVFSDGMLEQLRKKFELYRNSNKMQSLNDSWTYGINSNALSEVFNHWQFKYIYRERVRFLNQFDHFKTNIQGLDIHFLHVKPMVDGVQVVPLLLLHGWPSSIRDFYEAIPLLTTPRDGYDFVFEVIAPSLPGFIYSDAPNKPGLSPTYAAIIMRNLMHRLGFSQYYIQGGDFGHTVGSQVSTIFPDEVLGFHTTLSINHSTMANIAYVLGAIWPSFVGNGLEDRMYPLKDKVEYLLEEFGYMQLQATKPDTIAITLNDSPIGLAAYILDRFMIFTDPTNKYKQDGGLTTYSITDLLDNIMLYWSTGSMGTAMRFYKEIFGNHEIERTMSRIPTPVPTWAMKLKHEILHHPDFMLRWKYPNLLGSTVLEVGGHFAAFEKPKEFADDVFLCVERFREFHENK